MWLEVNILNQKHQAIGTGHLLCTNRSYDWNEVRKVEKEVLGFVSMLPFKFIDCTIR
jgi:hypothetical protein